MNWIDCCVSSQVIELQRYTLGFNRINVQVPGEASERPLHIRSSSYVGFGYSRSEATTGPVFSNGTRNEM